MNLTDIALIGAAASREREARLDLMLHCWWMNGVFYTEKDAKRDVGIVSYKGKNIRIC